MLLYVDLQAVPARKHTLFPPILALAHAAVESGRAFRPSAVEAATETSTTSAPKTASRFTDDPSDGQIDLIPDQVQPVGGHVNGVQLGLMLRRRMPDLAIVLLSNHGDPEFVASLPEEVAVLASRLTIEIIRDE